MPPRPHEVRARKSRPVADVLNRAANPVRCGIEPLEGRLLLASTPYYGTPFQLPTTIQAEDFDNGGEAVGYHDRTTTNDGGAYRNTGVDIEATTDAGGGYDVCFIKAGEWLNYTVNAPTSGAYTLNFRMASAGSGGTFHVEVDGVDQTGALVLPSTGGAQKWATVTRGGVNMTAGQHVLRVVFDTNYSTTNSIMGSMNWVGVQAPPPPPLPSVTIAATTPNASESGPTKGAFTVTRSGDTSVALTIPVAYSGSASSGSDYQALASSVTIPAGQTTAQLTVSPIDDTIVEGTETVVATLGSGSGYTLGGQTAATVSIADNDTAPPPTGNPTPYGGNAWAVPGVIQTENYDAGGEGVSYHDTTSNNEGGAYRLGANEGVDVEPASDTGGGYDVGFARSGEWMGYTVNVAGTGAYDLGFRVANYGAGGAFHLEVDGQNVTGALAVPDTGGFQNWTTVTKTGVSLTAGQHFVKLVIDGQSQYGFAGNFNWFQFTAQAPALPAVTIAATTPNAAEQGPTSGLYTVTRTGSTAAALTVNYAVSGTATNGTDYATLSGSVTIPAGAASATITLAPIDDNLAEGNETATLTLQGNAAYTVGAQSAATVTIADNDVATPPPPPPPGSPTPFTGTPSPIPGKIEFENFDNGGEGVAYHDTTAANEGTKYRTADGVDIESTTDTGGGYDVGYARVGEWMGYTTTVASSGNYDLGFRVANYGGGGAFHVEVDGVNVTGTLAVPDTGGFQNWTTVTKSGVALTSGQHFVKVVIDGVSQYGYGGNYNWMQFTSVSTPPPPTSTPFTGTPFAVGSTIEAENYDKGGEGVAYHDTTAANEGGAYRTAEGVDVEPTTDTGGGYDVGFVHAGEWMNYTVTIPTTGSYDLAARVAAGGAGGAFHVEFAGVNGTGSLAVPNTGGWQTYTTVTKTGIQLNAGTYVMRVVADANNSVGFTGNFNGFKLTATATQPNGNGSQPDLQIRNYGDTTYSGVGIINTTGAGQIRGNDSAFLPIIYQVRVVNNGAKPDSFNITGTPSDDPNWRVWYFDSQVQGNPTTGGGGNYITDAVTTTGWNTGVLQPGQSKDFRIEAGASPYLPANAQEAITLTATSVNDPTLKDVVKGTAINDARREVEVRRRNYAVTTGESGTYQLDLQNYGNIADQYVVTASGNGAGYTVKYFDNYAGGNDVTAAVTGSGWTTSAIGFHALQKMAVQLTSTDGQAHSVTFTVRSLADAGVTRTITISNVAPAVASPAFFPIGVFGMPTWAFDTWKARNANTLVGFDSFGGQNTIDQWTQAATDRGMYVVRPPGSSLAADAANPTVLAFEQPDEMDLPWNNYSPATAQSAYNAWKAGAPSKPVLGNFDGSDILGWQTDVPQSSYPAYMNTVDWGSSGIYPISGWNRPDDLDVSGRALDRLESISGGKPQFAIIESSNQKGTWLPPNSPSPTPAQVRTEVWDAIVHGAKGIIYFPQSFTPGFTYDNTAPDVAAEITNVNAQVTSIGAALEGPSDPPSLGFTAGSGALEATWRVYNGKKYYVVFNYSNQAVNNVSMTLQGANATSATVQGESRSVTLSGNTFTDSFAANSVHIYVV